MNIKRRQEQIEEQNKPSHRHARTTLTHRGHIGEPGSHTTLRSVDASYLASQGQKHHVPQSENCEFMAEGALVSCLVKSSQIVGVDIISSRERMESLTSSHFAELVAKMGREGALSSFLSELQYLEDGVPTFLTKLSALDGCHVRAVVLTLDRPAWLVVAKTFASLSLTTRRSLIEKLGASVGVERAQALLLGKARFLAKSLQASCNMHDAEAKQIFDFLCQLALTLSVSCDDTPGLLWDVIGLRPFVWLRRFVERYAKRCQASWTPALDGAPMLQQAMGWLHY